ncbi:hypothetical protein Ssi02_25190 [Sinosporangium siamense]|uniref:Uncharacterized protein n=1 Tax=Sinosporangium siamense TaxID=1367973 RepID=A0A919RES0_9ACTN|nr:hypothetical protein Ssi02_25190 [Sinosporangium siamense]
MRQRREALVAPEPAKLTTLAVKIAMEMTKTGGPNNAIDGKIASIIASMVLEEGHSLKLSFLTQLL